MNYNISLNVSASETKLEINYDEREFVAANKRNMQSAIELLVMRIATPKTQGIMFEYVDDCNHKVTIYCKVGYPTTLAEVGNVLELVESELIENSMVRRGAQHE